MLLRNMTKHLKTQNRFAMKHIGTILSLAVLSTAAHAQTIPGTNLVEKIFELNIQKKSKPSLSVQDIETAMMGMNAYIGQYPPRFKDEAERQTIYEKWLLLVAEAEAYANVNKGTEISFYLLSELYRQGHNMDVERGAEKSIENVEACLKTYTKSVPCNQSASYLYLSIGVDYLGKAEKSLSILRQHYGSDLNEEVEGGYVFLYLYQQDFSKAIEQIKLVVKTFPNSPRTKFFNMLLPDLEKRKIIFVEEEPPG